MYIVNLFRIIIDKWSGSLKVFTDQNKKKSILLVSLW